MLVLSITEVSKQRLRILLDTEESFVLYKGEIRLLKLKEGQEISESTYNSIVKGILPKRAKMRAMNLLQERNYTEYNLKKKLLDGGYPEHVAEEALEYVKSFGYVDDLKYAQMYIKEKEGQRTRPEIMQKLLSKGISTRITEEAYRILGEEREEYGEATSSELEEELIRKTLKKRGFTGGDYEEKQKMLAYFYRRGFNIDKVRRIMDEI